MLKSFTTHRAYRSVSRPKLQPHFQSSPGNSAVRSDWLWAVVVIATALVEATWLTVFRVQGVLPDLMLVLVVYYAFSQGEERAMFTGLLGGIFQDAAADTVLGHHVMCLVLVGFLFGRMARRLITDNPAVKAGSVFIASVIHDLLYITADYTLKGDGNAVYAMSVGLVPRAFYTALMTPFLFAALNLTVQPVSRAESR